jgi:hypothetical protein
VYIKHGVSVYLCLSSPTMIRLQMTLVDKTGFLVVCNIDDDTFCGYSGPVVSNSAGFMKVHGV